MESTPLTLSIADDSGLVQQMMTGLMHTPCKLTNGTCNFSPKGWRICYSLGSWYLCIKVFEFGASAHLNVIWKCGCPTRQLKRCSICSGIKHPVGVCVVTPKLTEVTMELHESEKWALQKKASEFRKSTYIRCL